jgi:hypothetical protein
MSSPPSLSRWHVWCDVILLESYYYDDLSSPPPPHPTSPTQTVRVSASLQLETSPAPLPLLSSHFLSLTDNYTPLSPSPCSLTQHHSATAPPPRLSLHLPSFPPSPSSPPSLPLSRPRPSTMYPKIRYRVHHQRDLPQDRKHDSHALGVHTQHDQYALRHPILNNYNHHNQQIITVQID